MRHRKKRGPGPRPKAPLWARLCVWTGAVVVVLAIGVVVTAKAVVWRYDSSIHRANLLGTARTHRGTSVTGPLNVLVIGSNYRDSAPSNGERADTIMIVHITKDLKHAFMISVPRDLYTTIQPDPKIAPNYQGSTEKLDAALNYGGMPLMSEAVSNLTGIRFDAAVESRFDGFQKAVQDLGGVCMYVDEETTSVHIGYTDDGKEEMPYSDTGSHPIPVPGVTPVTYHVGYQCLKPWQALDFVRQRELLPNGDYDRQRHQQQFMAAVLKQIASKGTLSDPVKFDKAVRDIGSALTVDTGSYSPTDLAWALHGLSSDDLTGLRPPSHPIEIDGTDYVQGDPGMSDLWQALRDDTVDTFVLAHPTLVNQLHPTSPVPAGN
jgi:LCP family protein required for cell wall assembly